MKKDVKLALTILHWNNPKVKNLDANININKIKAKDNNLM